MGSGFDDDDDFEEVAPEGEATSQAVPLGEEVEEEVWDEADFDDEFDEDFDAEPDEDLERFEQELNAEDLQNASDADADAEFGEEEDF